MEFQMIEQSAFDENENARNILTGACRAIPRIVLTAATATLADSRRGL